MLSTGAFNALLKTLEEPPAHVKFILATTEPQKLPATILSRCQRFDYKKIKNEDIIKRLKIICDQSNIKITDEALKTIAILSEGAMRDAISILERCGQETSEEINIDLVKDLVGLPSLEHIHKITKAILENDEIIALEAIDDVINSGKDLYNFLWEVIKYVKDILVYKATKKLDLYTSEEIAQIEELANKAEKNRLLDIVYKLSDLENNIKNSTQKTIMLQAGIIKICMKQVYVANNAQSENRINQEPVRQVAPRPTTPQKQVQTPVQNSAQNVAQNFKQTQDWKEIVEGLRKSGKIRLYTCLISTSVNKLNDQTWEIVFPNGLTEFNKKVLEEVNNRNDLIKHIALLTGQTINIKLKDGKKTVTAVTEDTSGFDDLGIDINIID